MVRQDILGGLRVALSKGEPLQSAMQSFYNSGYKKEDIEEAAQALYTENPQTRQTAQEPASPIFQKSQQLVVQQTYPSQIQQAPSQQVQQPIQTQQTQQSQQPQVRQFVSNYEQPEQKKKIDLITIVLVLILVCLLGVLAGVFFFKQQLVEFLTKYLD